MSKKVRAGKTNIRERKSFASRLGGTKSRAALALAVSLWIVTGGVASASVWIDVTDKDTVRTDG
ncbi:MAG: hypothetical protein J6I74_05485, partial [Schwartzia sp.]|nr:hypothetical protein [Schwartzia sp. (in: firmicutes)]